MEEIFLDTTLPGFKEEEERIKREGYVEKKFTRSTKNEIEGAFKRYLFKELIPERKISTPAEINILAQEINSIIPTRLYTVGTNGDKFMKFKMYIPSEKLRKKYENEGMNTGEIIEEEFAPENYGKILYAKERKLNTLLKKAHKSSADVTKLAADMKRHAAFPYGSHNQNVKAVYEQLSPQITHHANISRKMLSDAESAIKRYNFNRAEQNIKESLVASESAKKLSEVPMNILADMMVHTNFGTYTQFRKMPNGSVKLINIPEYKEYSPELRSTLSKMGIRNISKKGGKRTTKKRRMTRRR